LAYSVQLSYAFRTGALIGVAGARLVRAFARSTADHVVAWEKHAGGCFIHGWPPCRCTRCIVLHHGLGELASAVGTGGTLTIVG
jgi:hypothetical protein